MRDPNIIRMTPQWLAGINDTQVNIHDAWVPARPLGFASLSYRLRATWLVWTGRADALVWPGQ